MAFSLHPLSETDADRVAMIHRAAREDRLPWLPELHTPDEDRQFFRTVVFDECEVWGAVDGEIVGFIAFREGWIDHLYVLPQHQSQGAGHALLKVAQAASPSLQLWTFQRNGPARAFYEKRGFVAVRFTDGSDNEEREPDILYRWDAA